MCRLLRSCVTLRCPACMLSQLEGRHAVTLAQPECPPSPPLRERRAGTRIQADAPIVTDIACTMVVCTHTQYVDACSTRTRNLPRAGAATLTELPSRWAPGIMLGLLFSSSSPSTSHLGVAVRLRSGECLEHEPDHGAANVRNLCCMCVCVRVCVFVCAYVRVRLCVRVYIHIYIYIHTHIMCEIATGSRDHAGFTGSL